DKAALLRPPNLFTAVNTHGPRKNSPEMEVYAAKIKPDVEAWAEEVRKLTASQEADDKARVQQLLAKIAAAQAPLLAEVAPLPGAAVGTISVTSPLGTQESRVARLLGDKNTVDLNEGQD